MELDTVRGTLISGLGIERRDNQAQVAGEVRELRDEMGAVAEPCGGIRAARVPDRTVGLTAAAMTRPRPS